MIKYFLKTYIPDGICALLLIFSLYLAFSFREHTLMISNWKENNIVWFIGLSFMLVFFSLLFTLIHIWFSKL